jgi:glycosyltransferase involved in cell wall biosynthesis
VGWGAQGLRDTIANLGLTDRVIFLGYVADAELPLLYNAATVFAYPSLYEGFGLPVIEAQACGTAVLTSNSSSLPEAAGEAAMMVDPRSVEELAHGLAVLLSEPSLRQELRTRGLAHARRFDWRRTAQQTAGVYNRAVANGSVT